MSFCHMAADCGAYAYEHVRGYFVVETQGQIFRLATLQDMRDKLAEVREAGVQVPEWVFEEVDAELTSKDFDTSGILERALQRDVDFINSFFKGIWG